MLCLTSSVFWPRFPLVFAIIKCSLPCHERRCAWRSPMPTSSCWATRPAHLIVFLQLRHLRPVRLLLLPAVRLQRLHVPLDARAHRSQVHDRPLERRVQHHRVEVGHWRVVIGPRRRPAARRAPRETLDELARVERVLPTRNTHHSLQPPKPKAKLSPNSSRDLRGATADVDEIHCERGKTIPASRQVVRKRGLVSNSGPPNFR